MTAVVAPDSPSGPVRAPMVRTGTARPLWAAMKYAATDLAWLSCDTALLSCPRPPRKLRPTDGSPLPGLYAAGEVNGFGGGGMMGYNALEGTFLGGCLFSGRVAGRAAADAVS
jgi:hypothetical protein